MPRDGAIIFADLIGQARRAVQVRAIKSVAENQKPKRASGYTRNRGNVLITILLAKAAAPPARLPLLH